MGEWAAYQLDGRTISPSTHLTLNERKTGLDGTGTSTKVIHTLLARETVRKEGGKEGGREEGRLGRSRKIGACQLERISMQIK